MVYLAVFLIQSRSLAVYILNIILRLQLIAHYRAALLLLAAPALPAETLPSTRNDPESIPVALQQA
jgi:hypothetical protein